MLIEFGSRRIRGIIKASDCFICLSLQLMQILTNLCLNNSSYPTRPHSIIVYYSTSSEVPQNHIDLPVGYFTVLFLANKFLVLITVNSQSKIFTISDIDECSEYNDCHSHADCENTEGSYTCSCRNGFFGDGKNCTGNKNLSCFYGTLLHVEQFLKCKCVFIRAKIIYTSTMYKLLNIERRSSLPSTYPLID